MIGINNILRHDCDNDDKESLNETFEKIKLFIQDIISCGKDILVELLYPTYDIEINAKVITLNEKMSHTYISCLPVSMHMKYLKPTLLAGKCYDRSLYMFFCFPNAVLVRGDNKDLELGYGKENAGHGWIEMDNYCYDPTLLLRFKKDIYYEMYKPSNVTKTTAEEYKNCCDSNRQIYDDIVNTKLSDFQPNGRKRTDLCIMIPLIKGIAEMGTNENLKKELNDYLKAIQYDEKQVYEEMNAKFQKCLKEASKSSKKM